MNGLSNKTKVITVAANTPFTGSIQKLYSTGSIVLSLEIKTSFLKQVNPGEVFVFGRVIKSGKSIAFLEGELRDNKNNLLAKANQTVKLIRNFYK